MSAATTSRQVAFIGLGSNLEDPEKQIRRAIWHLERLPDCDVVNVSSMYRTAPFGPVEQPDFVNAVAALECAATGRDLLRWLKEVEARMGRTGGGVRWGPRVIDLDLLVLGDARINEEDLIVPHPGIAERNFVLLPLREIAPDLNIPGLGPLKEIAVDERTPRIARIA